jgi:DNA-binding transcriptional LysR family regulator
MLGTPVPNITQLRSFVAVAEAGNISHAAKALFIAQPALSLQIKRLEADLGVPLFVRLPHGVKLTAEGEQLLDAAEEALRAVDRLLDRAAALREEGGAELTVGLMAHGAGDLTPGILRRLRRRHPTVKLRFRQFDFEDTSVGLGRGLVDVGFLTGPVDPIDGIEVVTLRREPIVAAVASDHPLATRDEVSISELVTLPFITDSLPEGAWHDFWLAMHHRRPGDPVPTVTFASHDEHLDAVALDLGVSICPESTQRFYPRPGVTFVPVPDMEPAPLNLVWRRDRSSPLVLDFIASAKDAARELAGEGSDAGLIP